MSRCCRSGITALFLVGVAAVAGIATARADTPADSPPNLLIDLSRDLVKAFVDQVEVKPEKIVLEIVKSDVRGMGLAKTFTTVELIPDARQATVDIMAKSHIDTDTVSVKGPVSVFNTGVTRIKASKRIHVTPYGLFGEPAVACADVQNDLNGIKTKCHGVIDRAIKRIAERSYWDKACEAKAESEAKSAANASRDLETELAPELAQGNKALLEDLPKMLEKYSLQWDWIAFRTSCDVLSVHELTIDEYRYRLPALPPPVPVGVPALTVRMHESLPNTGGFYNLRGQTYDRKRLEKELQGLPASMRPGLEKKKVADDEEEPFELTFTYENPLVFHFADDRIQITLRNTRFKSGDTEVKRPWATTVTYKMDTTPRGIVLTRVGRAQSQLLDKKPGQGLGGGEIAARRLLQNRLSKNFPEEIVLDEVDLPDDMKHVGKLKVTQGRSTQGWLLLGCERVPGTGVDKPKDKSHKN